MSIVRFYNMKTYMNQIDKQSCSHKVTTQDVNFHGSEALRQDTDNSEKSETVFFHLSCASLIKGTRSLGYNLTGSPYE